jgi:hypothetical protein
MKPYFIPTILFVFLSTVVLVSCQEERVASSATSGYPALSPANPIYLGLGSVSGTDQVFYFLNSSTYPIRCNNTYCTVRSRYILRKDGSFSLQYSYDEGNEFRRGIQYDGRYTQTNNIVSFSWEGWSVAGPWGATGTLRGDTPKVEYNPIMALSDFDDGVYLPKR